MKGDLHERLLNKVLLILEFTCSVLDIWLAVFLGALYFFKYTLPVATVIPIIIICTVLFIIRYIRQKKLRIK